MAQKTDVLIIGSGSAGLMAALWLTIYKIPFILLERRSGPLEIGQADGVQVRTVEIYESFGLSEEVLREAYHILEVAFWGPDEGGGLMRKSRSGDTERGLSHLPHVILNQARMNGLVLGEMERRKTEEEGVRYGVEVKELEVDPDRVKDPDVYCVKVRTEREETEEVYEAKYVLGCDGAHSTVRRSLGYTMLGDTTDTVWGVMDIYPLTTFPDIRRKSTLHSASGNLLIIPREGGHLVRFYIQLPVGTRPKSVTLADLQATAKAIFAPYEMGFAGCKWWSAYAIGQRLASQFHRDYRVFLTGDACHTHSPKAGQGMNVSLQDGYNIGWKLGAVLSGQSPTALLETYVTEREKTAKELIEFDRLLAKLFSERGKSEGEFARFFVQSGRYTAGLGTRYGENLITDETGGGVNGIEVGMRIPSAQVVRFCDCKAMQFMQALRSDGRWRIIVFAGDIGASDSKRRLDQLSSFLEILTKRFTPPTADIDSLIEPLLVLRSKFLETEQNQIPDYFWPKAGLWRIRDLHKTYVDDEHFNSGHGHAYEKYGVDPSVGAVVILRPDQYVAQITTMQNFEGIERFLQGFLIERGYVIASMLCAVGGFLFGNDTGIIGPVTVMQDFTKYVGNPSPTIHGLIVSSILIPAAVSSFFAGKVADHLGRPRGIAIGSFIFAVGAALEAASVHIAMFVVGRVIEGVGEGLYLGTLVVYICEISPPRHRGALATGPQLLVTLGLVAGFFTCYGTTNIASSFSWRLPFLLLACYSFLFSIVAFFWLPASPRWLTLRGRASEAAAAWERLGVPAADQEKILDQFETSIPLTADADVFGEASLERVPSAKPKKKDRTLHVFSADTRPRLFLAVFLMGMQQLSGIDGVLYYAPILFQQAGLASNEAKFLASGVSAIVIFAVTIPATIWADGWARRSSTIFGGVGMATVMFLIGGLYVGHSVHAASGAGRWVVIVSIYVFAAIYSVSWGVGIKIYAAEIQPQRTRATATSMAHGSNWLSNFLVALVTPTLLAKSSFGAYFLFGGCTLLTAVVCGIVMPETRGRSLNEIEQAFHKSRIGGIKRGLESVQKNSLRRRPAAVDV